jgi:hypothetical protein
MAPGSHRFCRRAWSSGERKLTDSQSKDRLADLIRFYELLTRLEEKVGGKRTLSQCNGRMSWPSRGVYFFFEPGESRSNTGTGARVVRVGTHGLKAGSRASLWNRLSAHGGTAKGGNHRGSIFRLLVGAAMKGSGGFDGVDSWGVGSDMPTAARRLGRTIEQIKGTEGPLEKKVSDHIRAMPFLWIPVDDDTGPNSHRGTIERGSIALLSSRRQLFDPPSENWLGAKSERELVRSSCLWNNNYVDEIHDSEFLDLLERYLLAL